MENGNPRSAAHVQEEEESIGGAAAKLFSSTARVEEERWQSAKSLPRVRCPSKNGGGAERTDTQAGPAGGTPSIFGGAARVQAHTRAGPAGGTPSIFWRRRAALRLLPWTRAGFKTVFSDFGGGGGQFLFEVTSTRAADFWGRRRPVRP